MNIGLLGYGKMGRAIEEVAEGSDVHFVWRIGRDNRQELTDELLKKADVVIEFSRPEAALSNVKMCLEAGIPVVSGTTGWLDQLPEAYAFCLEKQGAMLWASNFSVGVNLFFALNRYLATLMNNRPEYDIRVQEIHHMHKLDAPSGTALTLTLDAIKALDRKLDWKLTPAPASATDIPVEAIREGEVPGTHKIKYESSVDSITIEHKAHSRKGFAAGALLAAQWIHGKKGVFDMMDVLEISRLVS
ncbi:MAG: 4-hydroxy-tetrahydrodipicolinate reductase [Saprospiraceae bacterium]|nr:4-hydroxy-tetrahydrodipicolinate reductase [Saprospiraceae bacterium]